MAMMGPTRGRGRGRQGLVSEINVTPMVDVMLVLLIIFMVTAPMMTQGVDVDLPETTPVPLKQEEEPVVVTINRQGEIFLDNVKGNQALLRQQLTRRAREKKDQPVLLKADREVPYGLVVSVMADIKTAGFDKLGMITQPVEQKR